MDSTHTLLASWSCVSQQQTLQVMWNDIDYMNGYRPFTLDPVNFPEPEMQAFLARCGRLAFQDPSL